MVKTKTSEALTSQLERIDELMLMNMRLCARLAHAESVCAELEARVETPEVESLKVENKRLANGLREAESRLSTAITLVDRNGKRYDGALVRMMFELADAVTWEDKYDAIKRTSMGDRTLINERLIDMVKAVMAAPDLERPGPDGRLGLFEAAALVRVACFIECDKPKRDQLAHFGKIIEHTAQSAGDLHAFINVKAKLAVDVLSR
jgi:hypothetical protein